MNLRNFIMVKSDNSRYEILNKFGGIFIDADSLWINEATNSLDDIILESEKYGFFCAKEPKNTHIYANGVIGCTPNHKILTDMIEHIKCNYFELKKKHGLERQIWLITGTNPFSDIINNNYKNFKNVLILEHFFFLSSIFSSE